MNTNPETSNTEASNERKDTVSSIEQEIYDLYQKVKSFEELFGVGGNPEAEEYASYGKSGIDSLGGAANYGRCQQAWTQATFALEQVIHCGPQNIQLNKILTKKRESL